MARSHELILVGLMPFSLSWMILGFVLLLGRARVEVAEGIVVPDQGFGCDILEIASR